MPRQSHQPRQQPGQSPEERRARTSRVAAQRCPHCGEHLPPSVPAFAIEMVEAMARLNLAGKVATSESMAAATRMPLKVMSNRIAATLHSEPVLFQRFKQRHASGRIVYTYLPQRIACAYLDDDLAAQVAALLAQPENALRRLTRLGPASDEGSVTASGLPSLASLLADVDEAAAQWVALSDAGVDTEAGMDAGESEQDM